MTAQNANGMGSLKSEMLLPSRTTFDLSFLEVLRIRLGEEKKRKDYLHCRVDTKDLLPLSTFRWQLNAIGILKRAIHTANFGRPQCSRSKQISTKQSIHNTGHFNLTQKCLIRYFPSQTMNAPKGGKNEPCGRPQRQSRTPRGAK